MSGFNDSLPSSSAQAEVDAIPDHFIDYIIAYNVFEILGLVTLIPVILTAWFSRRVQRATTWFPFMASWIATTVAYSLLMGQQIGPPPNPGVCLFQASLIYATPALTATTAVAFLCQVFFSIYSAVKHGKPSTVARSRLLFISPVVVFFVIAIYVLVMGAQNPGNVNRSPSGMYCHLSDGKTTKISAVLVIIAMTVVTTFEVATAILLYRNWAAFRRLRPSEHNVSLSVLIRVSIFTFLPFFTLVISLLAFNRSRSEESQKLNLAIATLPLLAALVFGTQKDILCAWFRRPFNGPSRDSVSQQKLTESQTDV
ncbi:hypothetical protein AX16_002717 [Volvariella volvacea WC 439]|nr:hypothetical protein AX16_002717 [Volvariella volvacea WC 439]